MTRTGRKPGRPRTEKKAAAPKTKFPARLCKNCSEPFLPVVEWQTCCTETCRKEFWRHGGISIARILPTIEQKLIAPLRVELAELKAQLANLSR